MSTDPFAIIERLLIGKSCVAVRREFDWALMFDEGITISLPIPWRIVDTGRIVLAHRDDGQRFGLPAPLDGAAEANRHLGGKAITSVSIDKETGDLAIMFGATTRVDTFNNSSGHEGWQIQRPSANGGLLAVALGGGEVAIW